MEQKNPEGQTMLASTLIPQPHTVFNTPLEGDVHMSFGRSYFLHFSYEFSPFKILTNCFESSFHFCSMLLHGLILSESDGDLEVCCCTFM